MNQRYPWYRSPFGIEQTNSTTMKTSTFRVLPDYNFGWGIYFTYMVCAPEFNALIIAVCYWQVYEILPLSDTLFSLPHHKFFMLNKSISWDTLPGEVILVVYSSTPSRSILSKDFQVFEKVVYQFAILFSYGLIKFHCLFFRYLLGNPSAVTQTSSELNKAESGLDRTTLVPNKPRISAYFTAMQIPHTIPGLLSSFSNTMKFIYSIYPFKPMCHIPYNHV